MGQGAPAILTLQDLVKLIAIQLDPNEIVEMLDISSQELCERFSDKIEDRFEDLQADFIDEEEEEPSD